MSAPDERTPLVGQDGASNAGVSGTQTRSRKSSGSSSASAPPVSPPSRRTNGEPYGLIALLAFIVVIVVLIVFLPRDNPRGASDHIVSGRVLTRNIFEHLNELFDRAETDARKCNNDHDGSGECASEASRFPTSRAVLAGYNSSASYVFEKLKNNTHCNLKQQYFRVPVWEKVREAELSVTFFTRLGCDRNKDQPCKDKPGKDKPGKDKPGKDKPDKGKPGNGKPGNDKPGNDKPGNDKPGNDKPGNDKPGNDEPGNDELGDMFKYDHMTECNGTYYVNNTVVYRPGFDVWQMRNGGQTHTLSGQQVYNVGSRGCDGDAQWLSQVKDRIALVEEGRNCTFWDIAYKAQKAGASGVIFYKPDSSTFVRDRVRIIPWQYGDPVMEIPVLLVTSSVGQLLATARDISNTDEPRPSLEVSLSTSATLQIATTSNLICAWAHEDHMNKLDTIVLGAHLDSVPEGPGMVDNGSGSMTLLEIVLALDRAQYATRNPLVFVWFGAEELGSLGARHYVRNLTRTGELDDIAVYLNFDMLGSPNWIPMVYNGEDAPEKAREGSRKVSALFAEYFSNLKQEFQFTPMVQGSDFVPFLLQDVPSGGLYTGSSEIKNVSQATLYGGLANVPLDPCYHQTCDQVENVNANAIETMSQATLHAIATLSQKSRLRVWLNTPPEKPKTPHPSGGARNSVP